MQVNIRKLGFDRFKNLAVAIQSHIREKPALDAYLGCAGFDCLPHLPKDLGYIHPVAVWVSECAEPACSNALARKVDVSVEDVCHCVADRFCA